MSSESGAGVVLVNVDNFVRAESDRYFDSLLANVDVNTWEHQREPASVDDQRVVRLNRDTLYSTAVVDIGEGATLTLPPTGGRYQTAMIVNQDHYINRVADRPGTYELTVDEFDTAHVLVAARTLIDPADPDDAAAAHALQDGLRLRARSARPFTHPGHDRESMDRTRGLLLQLAADLHGFDGAFGSRQETDPVRHLIGTAAGWGGLPTRQAAYVGVEPRRPVGHYTLTVGEVPARAFWSVSVYNRDGYFEKNALGRYSVNSVTALRDPDGRVTIHFGGDASLPNQIPIMDGWNYTVRIYQPEPPVLDGSWSFPAARAAD